MFRNVDYHNLSHPFRNNSAIDVYGKLKNTRIVKLIGEFGKVYSES